jgi:Holliday junction resolvasome RuvABC DNA-binding subunit
MTKVIIDIDEDVEVETVVEEVLGQIKNGNTSGVYPTWEICESSEDIEMLQRENKAMAEAFEKLGYTQEQISDIANGAI